jgi:hypothetical protein
LACACGKDEVAGGLPQTCRRVFRSTLQHRFLNDRTALTRPFWGEALIRTTATGGACSDRHSSWPTTPTTGKFRRARSAMLRLERKLVTTLPCQVRIFLRWNFGNPADGLNAASLAGEMTAVGAGSSRQNSTQLAAKLDRRHRAISLIRGMIRGYAKKLVVFFLGDRVL